ncbi:MAG: bifunctional riboflavin kinase/FAD synthetase [Thermoproteota archaeon]|nr:bifunctional riboflavin kinase/FAD synthetase [Thermoproteota archaeon]
MQVHRDINNLPLFKNAVITIGTFDGVHTGHLDVLQQLKKEALHISGESVIITFDPHPRMVIASGKADIKLLNTLDEKISLLEKNNIDHLIIVPFTKTFSELSAEEYITEFLVNKFHPHTIIIGYDHHFGNGRKGNYKLLEAYAAKLNYVVKEIPVHVLDQVTISSTKIRDAILKGDIETANEYLGYDYFFEGSVVEGNKLGRTLGYPTANIELQDKNKLVPANGIYIVELSFPGIELPVFKGMMSIGIRPTIADNKRTIEVNIFDFDKDIYGETVKIYVKKYLREEKKFPGLEELKNAIAKDKMDTLNYFSK